MRTMRGRSEGGLGVGALVVLGLALALSGSRPAWARGGGGCFLAGTPILRADGTAVDIATVRAGDEVLAFGQDGATVAAAVREVLVLEPEQFMAMVKKGLDTSTAMQYEVFLIRGFEALSNECARQFLECMALFRSLQMGYGIRMILVSDLFCYLVILIIL